MVAKPFTVIDATIVHENGVYDRFSKDEKGKAITKERAAALAGPWTDVPGFTLASLRGYEGPECYVLSPAAGDRPATWCLVLDHFQVGQGYQPYVTHDLASGRFEPGPGFKFPFKLRHGSVLPVTKEELARLRAAYP